MSEATKITPLQPVISEKDQVPPQVRELMQLFAKHSGEMEFPGVNLESLEQHADEVRSAARAVDAVLAELESARAILDSAQSRLVEHAIRAQSYALVFASDQEKLRESITGIELKVARASKTKARRRVKKAAEPEAKESQLSLARGEKDSAAAQTMAGA